MRSRHPLVVGISASLLLGIAVAAWFLFAPEQLGGGTSYVIVSGNSMEPRLHGGDLAVIRGSGPYRVGDIATYVHPEIGTVIHRVSGRDGDRYLFKGDHNSFIDPYHPGEPDLSGTLWFDVPKAGAWLNGLRSPFLAAAVAVVALSGMGGGTAAGRRKREQIRTAGVHGGRISVKRLPGVSLDVLAILGVAAASLAIVAAVAFRTPETRQVASDLPYEQAGSFDYRATATNSAVYVGGTANAGEPVYRRLSDRLDVDFTYALEMAGGNSLSATGTYDFLAQLSDVDGWKRTIELDRGTFAATPFTISGSLAFADLQALIDSRESETGVASSTYAVALIPRVNSSGAIAGHLIADNFAPELQFTLDPLTLKMAPRSAASDNPLLPIKRGAAVSTVLQPNTFNLPLIHLQVTAARWTSMVGLALALVACGGVFLATARMGRTGSSPTSVSAARLGDSVLSVRSVPWDRGETVELLLPGDFEKLAREHGCVVLHESRPGVDAYFVRVGNVTYRFQEPGECGSETDQMIPRRAA